MNHPLNTLRPMDGHGKHVVVGRKFRAIPQAARAGHASHRAVLHRLGHSVPIAIAALCIIYFAAELLRAVLS